MHTTRRAAVILARGGQILIEQRGTVLDPDEWDAAGRRGIPIVYALNLLDILNFTYSSGLHDFQRAVNTKSPDILNFTETSWLFRFACTSAKHFF